MVIRTRGLLDGTTLAALSTPDPDQQFNLRVVHRRFLSVPWLSVEKNTRSYLTRSLSYGYRHSPLNPRFLPFSPSPRRTTNHFSILMTIRGIRPCNLPILSSKCRFP